MLTTGRVLRALCALCALCAIACAKIEPPPGGPETAGEETMLYFEDVSGLIR